MVEKEDALLSISGHCWQGVGGGGGQEGLPRQSCPAESVSGAEAENLWLEEWKMYFTVFTIFIMNH